VLLLCNRKLVSYKRTLLNCYGQFVVTYSLSCVFGYIATLRCLSNGRVMATNSNGLIRVWRVVPADDDPSRVRIIGDQTARSIKVDSAIIASSWHDHGDVGVVGTVSGTIWHISTLTPTSPQIDQLSPSVVAAMGEPIRLVGGHTHFINQLVCHPSKTIVASASSDGSLRLWKVANKQLLQVMQFQAKDQLCLCVAFHPSLDLCALGYEYDTFTCPHFLLLFAHFVGLTNSSGQVRILDVGAQKQLATITMPVSYHYPVPLTSYGKQLLHLCLIVHIPDPTT
jgi:WD40 repeat protein